MVQIFALGESRLVTIVLALQRVGAFRPSLPLVRRSTKPPCTCPRNLTAFGERLKSGVRLVELAQAADFARANVQDDAM